MSQRRGMRITPEDIEKAEDVGIVEEKDYWNTCKLKDGSVIKMKLVVRGGQETNYKMAT